MEVKFSMTEMPGKNTKTKSSQTPDDLRLLHKYASTIESLDALPENVRQPILSMIKNFGENFS